MIQSVSKSTKLFYLVSYSSIMKGWKWKCESTQINAIFLPRKLSRTLVHCCKTSNSKTSVQIKTADNLQSQCDVNSNLQDHFQLNARLPSPFNSLQNLPPWLWSVCRYLASCNSAQSYIYISGKLDIAMQNICGVPVKGNIVF